MCALETFAQAAAGRGSFRQNDCIALRSEGLTGRQNGESVTLGENVAQGMMKCFALPLSRFNTFRPIDQEGNKMRVSRLR